MLYFLDGQVRVVLMPTLVTSVFVLQTYYVSHKDIHLIYQSDSDI